MGLEKFKKPEHVTFDIEGEKFIIDLPSRWNRRYVRGWQDRMAESVDDDGKFRMKTSMAASQLMDYQHSSFAENCFIESPLTPEELIGDYYPLLETLFDAASEIVKEKEAAADALVGKLLPSSSGKPNGAAKSISTESSKVKGESPALT